MRDPIRLGLIGDNIAASRSPRLHVLAGQQNGVEVTYDRIVPPQLGRTFEDLLSGAAQEGYHGVNVTYPYKEKAAALVTVVDPTVRAIGSVNTVLFEPDGPKGHNTDHSGFIAAYRRDRGDAATGPVLLIGAGGVGKAVAFALVTLGCRTLGIADADGAKARSLLADLRRACPDLKGTAGVNADDLAPGMSGLINCTPVGMVGHDGTPLAKHRMEGADWAFDAVYTPVDTRFLQDAQETGLQTISGYELFLAQGVDAWALFTGLPLDQTRLEASLRSEDP